ncbi:MAG: hypothetical protein QGF07_05920 [Phycisphaerales bacterium]|jgi:hypothetical protein|nr:hypothetical protein [Phycisphaerales bacterium]
MTRISLILITMFAFNGSSYAETTRIEQDGVSIVVTLEPSSFLVGDPITLQIKATTNGDKQLELNEESSFGPFTIFDQRNLLDIPSGEERNWIWSLHLDTFDSTAASISGITIHWTGLNGDSGSISIDPIPVQIKSVAGDELESMTLRDIKGAFPLTTNNWWMLVLGSIVFIVVLLFAVRKLFRKKTITLLPHEQAMQDLQSLLEANLDVLPFYTQLSDIVRKYIEGRFQIAATGQTTREFLNASKQNPHLEHTDRQSLATFLVASDLVKFARFEPTSNACAVAIEQAENFITATASTANTNQVEVAA